MAADYPRDIFEPHHGQKTLKFIQYQGERFLLLKKIIVIQLILFIVYTFTKVFTWFLVIPNYSQKK